MNDSLYQTVAPFVKAHPWILWILAVAFVLAVLWSFTPHALKVRVGSIPYGIGPRIVGVFDLASAIAMFVLGRIYHVAVEQIFKGNLPPETINRATPKALIAEALKQISPAEIAAIAHAAAPSVVVAPGLVDPPASDR